MVIPTISRCFRMFLRLPRFDLQKVLSVFDLSEVISDLMSFWPKGWKDTYYYKDSCGSWMFCNSKYTPGCWKWVKYICSNLSFKWLQVCCYIIVQVLQSATTKSTQIGLVETRLDHVWCCHCHGATPYFSSLIIDMDATLSLYYTRQTSLYIYLSWIRNIRSETSFWHVIPKHVASRWSLYAQYLCMIPLKKNFVCVAYVCAGLLPSLTFEHTHERHPITLSVAVESSSCWQTVWTFEHASFSVVVVNSALTEQLLSQEWLNQTH